MVKFLILFSLISVAYSQNGVPDARCPPGTPNPPLHLNDPSDCTRFFTCANGLAVQFTCPPGEHWGVAINRCDWPDVAQCQLGGSCPPGNPIPPVMFPHPTDCSRFLKCNWGVSSVMNCPPGQHWSVQHGWCDFPDRANCQLTGDTTRRPNSSNSKSCSSSSSSSEDC